MILRKSFYTCVLLGAAGASFAQNRQDAATYGEPPKNTFYEQIEKENTAFFKKKPEPERRLTMRFEGVEAPGNISEFKVVTAGKPVSQGLTNTCWSFSTSSFYESEAARMGRPGLRLSEMYTVYWEYVEKAKEFVRTRGESLFEEGSETNAVQRMMKKYGALPQSAYSGMVPGQPYPDHVRMFAELSKYMRGVKERNAWNKEEVVATVKDIIDHYIGTPPATVTVNGRQLTPKQYLSEVTGLKPDDYVTFMSLKSEPFWTNAEYKVGDNWWHSKDYYNVPLNDFAALVKSALKNGYSISIGGDVSESGIDRQAGLMMVPSYDIPSSYINDDARLLRFLNGSTTDDHAMHIIGYTEKPNGTWYLVKDSGSGGHVNAGHSGYWYMHEDYIRLKMMTATVHKSAVKDVLGRMAAK